MRGGHSYRMIAKKTYSPQFKAKAALDLIKEEKSVGELAAQYEVHYTLLHKRRRELLEGIPRIFEDPRKKGRDDRDALIRELYSQVGRLTMQLEWLEKKCGRTAPKI